MRGRKKKIDSKTKVISIRITSKQYEVVNKNLWIRKEISKQISDYLNLFVRDDETIKI